jgi:hypothetical protein
MEKFMKLKNSGKTIKQKLVKMVFGVGLGLISIGALTATETNAQTRTGVTRPSVFYYSKNYQAVNKQRLEMRRGNAARVYFDNVRGKWAVEVRYGAQTTVRTQRNNNNSTQVGNLPNGATILYFPTRDTAEGIYRASLRQGDWAKMWYDTKRREWAVAVKPNL